jgi:tetratricopeptide (TPR) repeat protein
MFTPEQKEALTVSMDIALAHEGENDTRATTAYRDVFDILEKVLQSAMTKTDRAETLKEFTHITGLKAVKLVEDMNCPSVNSGQYARYLDVLDRAVELNLIKSDEFIHERIELLVCLGRRKEAEELGDHLLKSSPNDIMSYVIYGDIYYLFEYLNEHQDLQKAEYWYYQAYDRFGWPDEPNEDWEILVERLQDMTIEKLRRAAYRRLRELLEAQDIGSHETVYQFIRATWFAGHGNAVMSYVQNTLLSKIMATTKNIEKANVAVKVLQDAYNLMPTAVEGWCQSIRNGDHVSSRSACRAYCR